MKTMGRFAISLSRATSHLRVICQAIRYLRQLMKEVGDENVMADWLWTYPSTTAIKILLYEVSGILRPEFMTPEQKLPQRHWWQMGR